jgi:hypothetical protein
MTDKLLDDLLAAIESASLAYRWAKLISHPCVPAGAVLRQWMTDGSLRIWMNWIDVAAIPHHAAGLDENFVPTHYYGIPVYEEVPAAWT